MNDRTDECGQMLCQKGIRACRYLRKNTSFDDLLYLLGVSGRNVGNCPGCFFGDVWSSGGFQEFGENGEGTALDHGVGLGVCSGYNVSQGPQGGGHDLEL